MKFNFFKRSSEEISHGAPGWVQQQASAARFTAQSSATTTTSTITFTFTWDRAFHWLRAPKS
jgi:hypothetical protein